MVKAGHFRAVLLFSHRLYPAHIWGSIDIDSALFFTDAVFTLTIRLVFPTALIMVYCVDTSSLRRYGAQVLVIALAMRPDLDAASIPLLYWKNLFGVKQMGVMRDA